MAAAARTQAAAAQRLAAELNKLPVDKKKLEGAIRLLLIQQKKEELYTLIDGVQSEFCVKGILGMHNTRLHIQLSLQVKPRHHDPRWRWSRSLAITGECFKYVGGGFSSVKRLEMAWFMCTRRYGIQAGNKTDIKRPWFMLISIFVSYRS